MPIIIIIHLSKVCEVQFRTAAAKGQINSCLYMIHTAAQTHNFTFSLGGFGEGVATEGHVVLSDLLAPPIYSQCLHWWACKVDPWALYTEQKCASQPHKSHHLYANPSVGFQRG